MLFAAAAAVLAAATPALAWGAAGHEIVATIAQIHLHPSVRAKLCDILPPEAHCHLAPIAAWADTIRHGYPGTAPMHYVNPQRDHPAEFCTFGEYGWINEDVNVLTAIMNKTAEVRALGGVRAADIPLRFLVHFVGDLHQPLHLTGLARGGNGAIFKFEGRTRSLHSVWDSGLITKNIRELGNYTSPTPSKQIEDALPGAIFDPYVRWIVWEGLRQWWRSDLENWLKCPAAGDPYPHSIYGKVPPSPQHTGSLTHSILLGAGGFAANAVSHFAPLSWLSNYIPHAGDHHGHADRLLANTPQGRAKTASSAAAPEEPACPYTWGTEIHPVNCEFAWPKDYNATEPPVELDTPEYLAKLSDAKTLESLLAMGGLRLAKILNTILGDGEVSALNIDY